MKIIHAFVLTGIAVLAIACAKQDPEPIAFNKRTLKEVFGAEKKPTIELLKELTGNRGQVQTAPGTGGSWVSYYYNVPGAAFTMEEQYLGLTEAQAAALPETKTLSAAKYELRYVDIRADGDMAILFGQHGAIFIIGNPENPMTVEALEASGILKLHESQ